MFAREHNGGHLDETHEKQKVISFNDVTKKDSNGSALYVDLTFHELKMALKGTGYPVLGQDQLRYVQTTAR